MTKRVLFLFLIFLFSGSQQLFAGSLSGNYRCWHFNVGGRGGRCTNPALQLSPNGHYKMSSEQGTYSVKGDQIILSESKQRGPGKLLENGQQIQFEYEYNGLHHTVTYLRQGD